jgi:hypothetical protein
MTAEIIAKAYPALHDATRSTVRAPSAQTVADEAPRRMRRSSSRACAPAAARSGGGIAGSRSCSPVRC